MTRPFLHRVKLLQQKLHFDWEPLHRIDHLKVAIPRRRRILILILHLVRPIPPTTHFFERSQHRLKISIIFCDKSRPTNVFYTMDVPIIIVLYFL